MNSAIDSYLNQLKSQSCWSVIVSNTPRSTLGLDFGGRVPRECPITNPKLLLSEDAKEFEGTYIVHLIECDWTLCRGENFLCCNRNSGPEMAVKVPDLVGTNIEVIDVGDCGSLMIKMSDNLVLRCLCTWSDAGTPHYEITGPDFDVVAGGKGVLQEHISTEQLTGEK